MIITSCPLRISLFGGSTDNPYFVKKYGYGSVISFTSDLKTYVTISQDKFGFNKDQHKYIINYSRREEVGDVSEIKNDPVRVVLEHFNMPPVQVTLTSDAYSQGSGLASSSSYIISLIKACCIFLGIEMTDHSWHTNLNSHSILTVGIRILLDVVLVVSKGLSLWVMIVLSMNIFPQIFLMSMTFTLYSLV